MTILSKLQEKRFDINELLTNYILFEILIVFIIEFILVFVFRSNDTVINNSIFSNYFVIKYIGISMVLACILPIVYEILRENN